MHAHSGSPSLIELIYDILTLNLKPNSQPQLYRERLDIIRARRRREKVDLLNDLYIWVAMNI